MLKTSIVICGAGIIGLTVARELVKKGHTDILIIEKERGLGRHASGRNSGVLHAGIYYSPGSVRAESCLAGNFMMRNYCKAKGLPVKESGKVIVARSEEELPALSMLYQRAIKNGATVELISEKELAGIEPNARTCCNALYSPYTAAVDPKKILLSLQQDLISSGSVGFRFNECFLGVKKENIVITNKNNIGFDFFINAAGAYSDKVAMSFGCSRNLRLVPFKGIYKQLTASKKDFIRGNIYPLPNIKNPFLGIHFSKNINGDIYIGPTAIPAFGAENYKILKGLGKESFKIFFLDAALFAGNKKFRAIAIEEPRKYFFKYFFNDAKKLVKELHPSDIKSTSKVGIRPQLVDLEKMELVMDFLIEKEERSLHILNSISPAFTSSMYFAKIVVNQLY